jgi:hypothetical protein
MVRLGVGQCFESAFVYCVLTLPGRVQHLSARLESCCATALHQVLASGVQARFCVVPSACTASRNTPPVVDVLLCERSQCDAHNQSNRSQIHCADGSTADHMLLLRAGSVCVVSSTHVAVNSCLTMVILMHCYVCTPLLCPST